MSNCNKQKLSKLALDLIRNATKNGQDLRYNGLQITTTEFGEDSKTMRNAFTSLFNTSREAFLDALDVIEKSIVAGNAETGESGRFDVKQKMSLLFKESQGERGMLNILNPDNKKDTDTLVEDSLGMLYALDAIQSEVDTQENSDVSPDQLEDINRDGVPTSLLRLAPTIGRAIAISRGKVLTGGRQQNHENYTKKGMEVLERLVKEELLSQEDAGRMVMGSVKTAVGERVGGIMPTPVIRVNEEKFAKFSPPVTGRSAGTSSDLLSVLKQLSRIISPYTELAPSNEATKETKTAHNKFQVESTTETLQKVQEGAMQLSPSITSFMDHLHDLYIEAEGDKSFEATLKQEFGVDDEFQFLDKVFGITVSKGDFTDKSDQGKKISRVGPLVGLMQNYSKINTQEFFLSYSQANNSRFFQRESILDVQADKQMARNMIESSHEFTYKGAEVDALIARIGVEFGIPKAVIKGEDTSNANLEWMLQLLASGKAESQRIILKQVSDSSFVTGVNSTNPWVIHKALRAIADVRTGLNSAESTSKNPTVKSKILLESDAAGSGPVLKLLQNMHKPQAINILKRLGLFKVSDAELEALGGPLLDFYQLAHETFTALQAKDAETNKGKPKSAKSAASVDSDKMKAIMRISGHGEDFRSFIKDPIIRFTYEQSPTENIKETAKLLAESIVLQGTEMIQETIDVLNIKQDSSKKGIKGPNKDISGYSQPMTKLEQEEALLYISKALQGSVAKYMVNEILQPTYSEDLFDGTKVTINKIFEVIERKLGTTAADEGITYKFMEPSVVLDWLDNNPDKTMEDFPYTEFKKHRLVGDKMFETEVRNGDTTELLSLYHANETSAHILPIHALDAAILIRAIAKVYENVNEIPGLEGLTPKEISILMIHDATILPPKIAHLVEDAYQQEIINASMNYDVVYMMLKEGAHKAALKQQEAETIRTGKKAPFVPMSIEDFGKKYDLENIVKENAKNRKNKFQRLNVRDAKGNLNVIPYSFGTNLEDIEFTKVRDPKNPSAKDGVDAGYAKRIKGAEVRDQAEPVAEPEIDESTNKDISVDFGKAPDVRVIEALDEALNSEKGLVVFDTEASGNKAELPTTEVFELAFTHVTKDGKTKSYSVNLPISAEAQAAMTSGFRDFYLKIHGDELQEAVDKALTSTDSETTVSKIIADHINKKASSEKEVAKAKEAFNKLVEDGVPFAAHNANYDKQVLSRVEGLNTAQLTALDTREAAYVVRRDALTKIQRDQYNRGEKVTDKEFIKDVTKQENLVDMFNEAKPGSIAVTQAHTALDDVKVLSELIPAMVQHYKDNPIDVVIPTKYSATGTSVRDQATGEFVKVGAQIASVVTATAEQIQAVLDGFPPAIKNGIMAEMKTNPKVKQALEALAALCKD